MSNRIIFAQLRNGTASLLFSSTFYYPSWGDHSKMTTLFEPPCIDDFCMLVFIHIESETATFPAFYTLVRGWAVVDLPGKYDKQKITQILINIESRWPANNRLEFIQQQWWENKTIRIQNGEIIRWTESLLAEPKRDIHPCIV